MVREAKGIPSPKRIRMGGETPKRTARRLRKRRDRKRKRQAVKRACSASGISVEMAVQGEDGQIIIWCQKKLGSV